MTTYRTIIYNKSLVHYFKEIFKKRNGLNRWVNKIKIKTPKTTTREPLHIQFENKTRRKKTKNNNKHFKPIYSRHTTTVQSCQHFHTCLCPCATLHDMFKWTSSAKPTWYQKKGVRHYISINDTNTHGSSVSRNRPDITALVDWA